MLYKIAFFVFVLQVVYVQGRIYDRCTLARELRDKYHLPNDKIPTWICIVDHESKFDTAARNPTTSDHGLFQISQLFWCDPPSHPLGCNKPCDAFRDDNIDDDVECIRKIYDEWQRDHGDGFKAWTTYQFCQGNNWQYVQDCGF